jgi:prolyl-tRNA editing enzyme YbaK/EbsC (Cys-tRNA(Pro) deacylase)
VEAALRRARLAVEIRSLDEAAPTAEDAARLLRREVGAIANSLIFAVGGRPLLVLASGAHRVDTRALGQRLAIGKIRRAGLDFVEEHTGQHVGGVAPVGHPAPILTVVDLALAGFDLVWAGAGDERTMFATTFSDLVMLTSGRVMVVHR